MKILVLDDDPVFQSTVAKTVRELGHSVVAANRIRDARVLLKSESIDIVFVDGLLPDGSGTEFVEELEVTHPSVRVVFVTAVFQDNRLHLQVSRQRNVAIAARKPLSVQTIRDVASLCEVHLAGKRRGSNYQLVASAAVSA